MKADHITGLPTGTDPAHALPCAAQPAGSDARAAERGRTARWLLARAPAGREGHRDGRVVLSRVFLLLSLIIGLGAGATILAGQAWGARDAAQVRRVGATAFVAALGIGMVVAVAGAFSAPSLMQALGTPPDILHAAIRYARAMLLVMPLVFVTWMVCH